ncbi:MAG: hypothetical protein KDI74_13275 [Gammaproteobacteria bacterium]|nr:hypothetical protein [Gammaproteobacteria bacterium]
MEKQDIFRLDIPERTPPPPDSLLRDPKEVERWISGLPMANIGETSRQIFKTLVELNRVEIPILPRIKTTELFRVPIGYITRNLRKYYHDNTFPLTAKNRKIAVLNRELYIELATAYKIIIHDMVIGEDKKPDRKLLVIAMQRAMSCLLRVLYQSVIVYDPFPGNTWRELHKLYAYAESNQLQDLPVKDDQQKLAQSSIKDIFIQALLFAIISPYRLRQREIEQCYGMLPEWAGKVRLGIPDQMSSSPTLFIARLNSNAAPLHIELQNSPIDKHCRQLNTGGLVSLLQDTINESSGDESRDSPIEKEDRLPQQLMEKLIQVLSTAQKRKYVRTNLNFELNLAVGLSDIHTLLMQTPTVTETAETPVLENEDIDWFSPREKLPLINSPTTVVHNIPDLQLDNLDSPILGETIYATGIQGTGDDPSSLPQWVKVSNSGPTEPFSCTTDNESAWGYCVLWPGPNTPKIRVGEVLGIHLSANEGNEFRIGVSRWLRNIPGHSLQVGLEIIGLTSDAVTAKKSGASNKPESAAKCILLPDNQSTGKLPTLLTPALPFNSGDRVILNNGGSESEVILSRLMESTGAFSQFQYKSIKEGSQERSKDSRDRDPDSDFDSIWTTI